MKGIVGGRCLGRDRRGVWPRVPRAEGSWTSGAVGRAEGFSRITPLLVLVVGVTASMVGLAYAMRSVQTGTAYAVWVGIGAVATVAYAMATGDEPVTALKLVH